MHLIIGTIILGVHCRLLPNLSLGQPTDVSWPLLQQGIAECDILQKLVLKDRSHALYGRSEKGIFAIDVCLLGLVNADIHILPIIYLY